MRRFLPAIALCLALPACGGGGGGGGSAAGPTPVPLHVIYVRTSGSDKNTGASPDHALGTIARAGRILKPGGTIYVGPGRYVGRVDLDVHGTTAAPANLIADTTGGQTGDPAGEVILDAGGDIFALRLSTATNLTVDGFVITGAAPSGNTSATQIEIRSASTNSSIQNCVIENGGQADGIRVQDSAGVQLFNNLIANNNRGVLISGASRNATLINNTIVNSGGTGITLKETGSFAPSGATLLNNIVQDSSNNVNISVSDGPPSSLRGYKGDFNLVFLSGTADQSKGYRPTSIRGDNDVNQDANFAKAGSGDFRLASASPAIDAGTDAIDPGLLNELLQESATADGSVDVPAVDLGYHLPAAQ